MPESLENPFPYLQKTFTPDQTAAMTTAIHEDGFALIPGVLSPQEVARLRGAIDRLKPFGLDHKTPVQERYKCIFNRERVFFDLIDRPGIVDLAEATMGRQFHIIGETAWRSHPSYDGLGPHTDQI